MDEDYLRTTYKLTLLKWEIQQIKTQLIDDPPKRITVLECEHVLFALREVPQQAIRNRLYELESMAERMENELKSYRFVKQTVNEATHE